MKNQMPDGILVLQNRHAFPMATRVSVKLKVMKPAISPMTAAVTTLSDQCITGMVQSSVKKTAAPVITDARAIRDDVFTSSPLVSGNEHVPHVARFLKPSRGCACCKFEPGTVQSSYT